MSVVSGILGAQATTDAANTQADASEAATAAQQQQYQMTRADMAPFMKAGQTAVNQLSGLTQPGGQLYNTDFTSQDFLNNKDPGYEWRKQQGVNALSASGAASGNYGSGNMGTALVDYGQNAASAEYQNAWNRWNQSQTTLYNRLAGIAGTGQTASSALGGVGTNTANAISSSLQNAGTAQAYGIANTSNMIQSSIGQGLKAYNTYNQLNNPSTAATTGATYDAASGAGYNYAPVADYSWAEYY